MRKRRTIAVIAADVFNDYMNRILVGISEQCKALGYDALSFLMAFNLDSGNLIQQGEENIFTLIRKDVIDGVILMAGNISSQNLVDKYVKVFSHWGIPVLAIDYDVDFCESVYAEDTDLFEQMTDHFIEKHGCKKITCLTGPEGNTPALSRLEGYRRSMEKHGLEIGEHDVVYGDFWTIVSRRIAKYYVDGEWDVPDAVVCANDVMARSLCNALVKGGFRIPDDIRVSGYDGSNTAILNIPSITTIDPENERLGAKAVCRLHKLITGEDAQPLASLHKGELLFARSCGCGTATLYSIEKNEEYHNMIERYEGYYSKSGMLESLMEEENLDGLLHKLNGFAYVANGIDTYMLCLCKGWDNVEEGEEDYVREGYAPVMETRIVYTRKETDFVSREFASADILPDFISDYCPEPSMYFLLPVHFMDRCFGYSIFRFTNVKCAESSVFAEWNKNISTALEFLRVRTKLISINKRIFMNSIRDTLTGIYNRKGFNRLAEGIFKKAKEERKKLFVLIADLDRLKMINDNFGHIEGDNAITIAANALNSCCDMNEVCARIGGDEYAIVGYGDYTYAKAKIYVDYIHGYFDRYNASSNKDYVVGLSLGYYCGVPGDGSTLEEYIELADEQMYADKVKRKMQRSD